MLLDTAAQANALKALYGDGHGSTMPATFTVHLYTADPRQGGVELAQTGGYAPISAANDSTNFPAPDANAVISAGPFEWTSTGAWSDVATWGQLKDSATGVLYNGAPFAQSSDPVNVTEGGTPVRVTIPIFFNEFGD